MWGESALSPEEKDRLIKERNKKERNEQSLAAASNLQPLEHHDLQDVPTEQCAPEHGYAKMGEGESPMLPQEEKDGLDKAWIRRERKEPNSVVSNLRSSVRSIKSDSSSTSKTKKKKKVHVKVEDDKKMRRSGKHRAMIPKASMRQSGWAGLYDNMIEEHLKDDGGQILHSNFSSCKIEEVDDVPAEKETERHRKSKHHSRDKKSSRRHKSDEKTEGKEKSRQRRRRATVSSEDGDDDDLSRRIKEKLREREQEEKSRRRHRRHSRDSNRESCRSKISEGINTIGSSSASAATNCESNSSDSDEDIDEEIRELIAKWTEKHTMRLAMALGERTPEMDWLVSFYHCDPRWQILKFFNEVAREGGVANVDENLALSPLAQLFDKANVFTVWRPTSDEAIKNMMLGRATGKGLDIKGKSAKRGNISSYVPFVQIYEDKDKERARAYLKDGRTIRVFYPCEAARDEAQEMIADVKDYMAFAAMDAMRVLSDEFASEAEQELAMKVSELSEYKYF
jgi:hypothetical protein